MTAIPGLDGLTNPSAPTTGTSSAMLNHNDFLRLMTTQLTTQDPFNPVDNTQMVAQMAQFSQVAGIAEMNKSLGSIAAALAPGRLDVGADDALDRDGGDARPRFDGPEDRAKRAERLVAAAGDGAGGGEVRGGGVEPDELRRHGAAGYVEDRERPFHLIPP